MRFLTRIRQYLRSSARRESGSLTLESLLLFPIFVMTISLTYTFFDGFRQSTLNVKAAYTVSDLLSREKDTVTDTYIESMHTLMQRMVNSTAEMRLRVSFIRYFENGGDDYYDVEWSTTCGFPGIWDNGNIDRLRDRLPPMADLEPMIIVESSNDYEWTVKPAWLDTDYQFENYIFTRPRFENQIIGVVSQQGCQS
ncbi:MULTISPECIES: TadE/TadG family type IV pilus assembly protein [Ruegeria]|nr:MULTISPECIES: pilus assembly protein [Ruegeria]